MASSKIEWTELTWNPTTGCSKVSQGCKFCYAETMSRRLKAMGLRKYSHGFEVNTHTDELDRPYHWRKPRRVFVNSMSDLFHESIPIDFIQKVFKVMNDNPNHVFQVLTKRSEMLANYDKQGLLSWSKNIWMGVSIEDNSVLERIDHLKSTKAAIKFLSCEPLLGPLSNLDVNQIDWVIVGGESGRKPRQMKEEWVIEIMQKCKGANVPFFFKQWGGTNKKKTGRILNGRTWDELPS